ncbi:uncharacterized protein LOC133957298 isoform X4 [Platichthys flesus]|uniref:uncharacterized protein LOC133957298 isoform X4 n=1 Tax=Platichthys flesus TaxID=8260 RepID=UPI002DBAF3D9|nr:uncharacterized protein LOC133957298 isoform X4 [Platichthys flesus]XP_062248789.1 uncharacterized protein LOC133957298 isoform X4 [Platichthys flesus]
MPMLAFFIKLLLVHYTTQSTAGIQAVCGGDVSLPCLYEDIESMDFISLAWYKVSRPLQLNNQSRNGIIRWKTRGNVTSAYSLARAADFGDKYSLMLRNVTPEDSGNYDCYISANIGGTNRNSYVYLTVQDCVTPTTSSPPPNAQVKELSVLWSILGFVAVGLIKVILSIISIWVIGVIASRQSKRR